jgi:hypothetical protein
MKYVIRFTDDMIEEYKERGNVKTWKAIELISEHLGIECDVMNTSLKDLGIVNAFVDTENYTVCFENGEISTKEMTS